MVDRAICALLSATRQWGRHARAPVGSQEVELFSPDPELTDGVVCLRAWRLDDLDCVRRAAGDPRIPADTTVPEVFTPDGGRAFIQRQWSRLEQGQGVAVALAEVNGDRAVGQVYVANRPQPDVVGLGYWVVPEARGHGLAARAARLASDWALGPLGAARVEAWVAPANAPSLRTLAAAGFTQEGVLRSFMPADDGRSDVVVLSRLATDPPVAAH